MGSRFMSLFFGKSSNNNALKGGTGSYDSAVALEPPVKGSYPVAGNGPNVLEEIQQSRARARKDARRPTSTSRRQSMISTFTPASSVSRSRDQYREDPALRPQTAPHNGAPGGGHNAINSVDMSGRTRSGFSMKSPPPPNFFNSNRQNSVRSTRSYVTVEALPPPLPKTPARGIQTYQPKKGPNPTPTPTLSSTAIQREYAPNTNGFVPPFAQHQRNSSHASHRSHVDLLDAHSSIRQGREASKHRAKASGVRNFGEDVADRNIADFGERDLQKLDLKSPDFSYLKSVYAPKKRQGGVGAVHGRRAVSARGHVLGNGENSPGDDTPPRTHGTESSIRSFPGPRPGIIYPTRVDSASASASAYGANRGRDDAHSIASNGTYDQREGALSPVSPTPASIYEGPPAKDPRRHNTDYTRAGSVPSRGRTLAINNPPPVAPPQRIASSVNISSPSATGYSKQRQRTMSTTSQNTNGGTQSRNGSVSYSAFPNMSRRDNPAPDTSGSIPRSIPNSGNKRAGLVVEGASEPPSLEGVIDLNNTVDTDVTNKTLPAVIHKTVQPQRHEIRQEVITRETHTHDVYHRILPVIETEILPTKHYVHAPDGKSLIEIPESEVPGRTGHAVPSRNWKIIETGPGKPGNSATISHQKSQPSHEIQPTSHMYPHQGVDEEGGADGPVIGLARGEPKSGRSRENSRSSVQTIKSGKSGSKAKNMLEPILSSKTESITEGGVPKTEYVWRHPPHFENAKGVDQGPVYIGAGIGDLSSGGDYYYSDDEDIKGAEFGAMRAEEDSMFRDSGYGSPSVLPGLKDQVEMTRTPRTVEKDRVGIMDVAGNKIGEATRALRRLRERRKSDAAVPGEAPLAEVRDLEREMKGLNV